MKRTIFTFLITIMTAVILTAGTLTASAQESDKGFLYNSYTTTHDVTGYTYITELYYLGNDMYGIITAFENDSQVWTYTTEKGGVTELDPVSGIHPVGDRIYICANGKLVSLNAYTGKENWKRDGVGYSNHYESDANENIYVSGYYGPAVKIFDKSGNLLYTDNDKEHGWWYGLEIKGNTLNITYLFPEEGIKTLDITQYNQKTANNEETAESSTAEIGTSEAPSPNALLKLIDLLLDILLMLMQPLNLK